MNLLLLKEKWESTIQSHIWTTQQKIKLEHEWENSSTTPTPAPIQQNETTTTTPITQLSSSPSPSPPPSSLFWCVQEAIYGPVQTKHMRQRGTNARIEERMRIVETLRKTPRILKESNYPFTLEKIQSLLSSLMMSPTDSLEDLFAYSAYYKKIFVVLFRDQFVRVFRNTQLDLNDDTPVVFLKTSPEAVRAKSSSPSPSPSSSPLFTQMLPRVDVSSLKPGLFAEINGIFYFVLEPTATGLRSESSYRGDEIQKLAEWFWVVNGRGEEDGGCPLRLKKECFQYVLTCL